MWETGEKEKKIPYKAHLKLQKGWKFTTIYFSPIQKYEVKVMDHKNFWNQLTGTPLYKGLKRSHASIETRRKFLEKCFDCSEKNHSSHLDLELYMLTVPYRAKYTQNPQYCIKNASEAESGGKGYEVSF